MEAPRPGFARADFQAAPYGPDYISLLRGEEVLILVCREQEGWAYGRRARDNALGWFPAAYWAPWNPPRPPVAGSPSIERPVDSAPCIERHVASAPSIERSVPSSERSVPSVERTGPLVERRFPSVEKVASVQSVTSMVKMLPADAGPSPFQYAQNAVSVEAVSSVQPAASMYVASVQLVASMCAAAVQPVAAMGPPIPMHPVASVQSLPGFPEPASEPGSAENGCCYSREELLQIGIALVSKQRIPADELQISMHGRPGSQEPSSASQTLEHCIHTLVDLAGGKARVGNLAAAGLALGIMNGSHSKVCQDILVAVREQSELFGPLPEVAPVEASKLTVTLRGRESSASAPPPPWL
mmetsp:Transcript_80341/g.209208  ORF Transcript_80341/g.209208 Transcript_80341/m.209208 type:complete len:356 (+) Transcript_80341:103-1170(+)